MRDVLHVYGMFFGFAVFAISAWISVSALSGFIMMVHCLIRLVKETR